jgi:hypothetical protein
VRPLVVVVPQVLVEDTFKVASTPDQRPVQTSCWAVRTQRSANALAFGAWTGGRGDVGAVGEDVVEDR